jgi:hypothetical protein
MEQGMRYRVIYRLLHPEYFSATRTSEVEARTHAELEAGLARIQKKWQTAGYKVRVLDVKPVHARRLSP